MGLGLFMQKVRSLTSNAYNLQVATYFFA